MLRWWWNGSGSAQTDHLLDGWGKNERTAQRMGKKITRMAMCYYGDVELFTMNEIKYAIILFLIL